MTSSAPQGIVAVWVNVLPEHRAEFEQFHNCEHMPQRLTCPGFQVGYRYRALGDEHDYLAIYEGDTPEAFRSEAYLDQLNRPTPWSRRMLPPTHGVQRAIYELAASHGAKPVPDAPYVLIVRLNPPEGPNADPALIGWYREEHLPRLCGVEGVFRGRLFRNVEEISHILTTERKWQKTAVCEQAYLALYEIVSPDLPGSDAWQEAAWGTARSREMRGKLRDLTRERYWLHFACRPPGRPPHRPE